jgi:glucose-6-phosphate isomerase
VNINAYHQPGVEAGKKAAAGVLKVLSDVKASLSAKPQTAAQIAEGISADPEAVFHALTHLAANSSQVKSTPGATPADDTFAIG